MNNELLAHYLDNKADLKRYTFTDKNGKAIAVLASSERRDVLECYLNHANRQRMVFVGVETLASETGLDKSNARRARDVLVLAGWLTPAGSMNYAGVSSQKLDPNKKGTKTAVNQYRVTLPLLPELGNMPDEMPDADPVENVPAGINRGGNSYPPNINININTPHKDKNEKPKPQRDEPARVENINERAARICAAAIARSFRQHPPTYPNSAKLQAMKRDEYLPHVLYLLEIAPQLSDSDTARQDAEIAALAIERKEQGSVQPATMRQFRAGDDLPHLREVTKRLQPDDKKPIKRRSHENMGLLEYSEPA